jgi:hypothetical protein
MRLLLIAIGTRGDIEVHLFRTKIFSPKVLTQMQPFVSIAKKLVEQSHRGNMLLDWFHARNSRIFFSRFCNTQSLWKLREKCNKFR